MKKTNFRNFATHIPFIPKTFPEKNLSSFRIDKNEGEFGETI